jgi:hypothetical protein
MKQTDLSEHLFWDVDGADVDLQRNKRFVIQRVLEYGTLDDWRLIRDHYGLETIADVAARIPNLDRKSACFVATLTHRPKEDFACYSKKPSTARHWVS